MAGAGLAIAGVKAIGGLFKKRAKAGIVAAKLAAPSPLDFATGMMGGGGIMPGSGQIFTAMGKGYLSGGQSGVIDAARQFFGFGTGGPQLPPIPPANFGGGGTGTAIINALGNAVTGAVRGGTAIQRHPGAVALPDGTIWYHGKLYVLRTSGRLQRVTRDKFGNIVPAGKRMNVLNPHALQRSMRRVEGFHHVASSAIKHMEKWARKTSHKRAPSKQLRGKKR